LSKVSGGKVRQLRETGKFSPESELLLDAASVNFADRLADWAETISRRTIRWDVLLAAAEAQGVQPLLWRFLDRMGPTAVPSEVLTQLRQTLTENTLHNLKMTGELTAILDDFAAQGIRAIPYKGPTLAMLAYGDLALREFGDLDILVNCENLPSAGQMLADRGYEAEFALAHLQDMVFLKISNALSFRSAQKQILVELHWTLSPTLFPLKLEAEQMFNNLQTVFPAGRRMETLAIEPLLLYLCSHGSRHCWGSLGWIADIAWLIHRHESLDWNEVIRLAHVTKSRRMLWLGLLLAHELLDTALPETVLRQIKSNTVISRLAVQVCNWLFLPDESIRGVLKRDLFYFGLQEKLGEKTGYLWRLLITPNIADWQFLRLPSALTFLYSALRPIRFLRDQIQSR